MGRCSAVAGFFAGHGDPLRRRSGPGGDNAVPILSSSAQTSRPSKNCKVPGCRDFTNDACLRKSGLVLSCRVESDVRQPFRARKRA